VVSKLCVCGQVVCGQVVCGYASLPEDKSS